MSLTAQQTVNLRTQLTPQLAQTMRLLQLSTAELAALITSELATNPALEVTTISHCITCGRRLRTLACPICDRRSSSADDPIVYLAARSTREPDQTFNDNLEPRATETLADYVRRQIMPALAPHDQPLADYLLDNLDEHGFLIETPENCAEILNVSLERVLTVLQVIQRADPIGVGARDVRESLLIQLESLESAEADRVLVRTLLADHWEQLGHQQLKPLAHQLRVPLSDINAAMNFIRRNLTPYPAQTYWHNRRGQAVETSYIEPDAIIHAPEEPDGALSIELFSPVAGWLRVNDAFRVALADTSAADRPRLLDCVEQAELLVRGLHQRTTTLRRVLEVIGREQRAYLLGVDHDLKAMTRAWLAHHLDVHESTISRAVADKHITLPGGQLVSLDHFFDNSFAVRRALKAIIAAEARPLTDDELAKELAQQGHVVARRTVAKYRDIEHILPATQRARREVSSE